MDLINPLKRYRELNDKLNNDEYQAIDKIISAITKHERKRRKKMTVFNYFLKLPIEILIMTLFMNYKEECPRGHKWCGNDKPNHRYSNRQTIFRLMEVCKDWYHIIGPKVQKIIVLNRKFLDFDEQKRSLRFTKLINSKNTCFVDHIKEIIIYDNFFFNSTMLKIVNTCYNLERLVLRYSTTLVKDSFFNNFFRHRTTRNYCSEIVFDNTSKKLSLERNFLKNLIDYYRTNNFICGDFIDGVCNEPIYWGKSIYWHYCSNHKSEFFTREHDRKISYINSDIGDSIICSDSDFNSDFEDL